MQQNHWKILLVVGIFALSIIFLLPTLLGRDIHPWPTGKLNLGLDLSGGMHIVYGVKTAKAVHNEVVQLERDLADRFKEDGYPIASANVTEKNTLELTFGSQDDADRARQWIDSERQSYETFGISGPGFGIRMKPEVIASIKRDALDQAREKIMRRVDQFGVREPSITTQGADRIVVQLPGVVDPEQAKKLLGTTAVLHFKIVPRNGFAKTKEELLKARGGTLPEGQAFYRYDGDPTRGVPAGWYVLPIEPDMTGKNLVDARPGYDEYGGNAVNFTFNDDGAKQFGELSAANIDRQLAIVLDDVVQTAPVLRSKITRKGQISGDFTRDDARNIAIVLRSGALPVPVEIEEERTVGPLLGKDSIHKGTISFIVGGVLVLLFMVVYYKLSGLVANVALVMNIAMIMGGLTIFDATLTFPGIAGIVLTVGMAVDANVIIFERIREELRIGKTPRAAIDTGYSKALWTILDANITTGGAALILFQFGTGPIKGFAVTLTIGIIASVFTAIVVTRLIFDVWSSGRNVQKLSI